MFGQEGHTSVTTRLATFITSVNNQSGVCCHRPDPLPSARTTHVGATVATSYRIISTTADDKASHIDESRIHLTLRMRRHQCAIVCLFSGV